MSARRPVVPAERRRMILELLRSQGSVSVGAVEEGFGVSPMTARRDLAILAENGYARRTHGGAVLPEDIAQAVLHFASPARSGKTTGNLLNVDGGVAAAYPR